MESPLYGLTGIVTYLVMMGSTLISLAQWYTLYQLNITTCECSKTWHRNALIVLVAINVILVLCIAAGWKPHPVFGLLGLSIVVISFLYIHELRHSTCGCVDKELEYALDIMSYGAIVMWALSIVLIGLLMQTYNDRLNEIREVTKSLHDAKRGHRSVSPTKSK